MKVRCTASSLVVRALPSGVDLKQRLKEGQTADAFGQSFDGAWFYVVNANVAGWVAKHFLEEVGDDEAVSARWIGCAEGNYHKGRPGNPKIDMIVIHVTEGSLSSVKNWFNNPAAEVSAHYCIGLRRELLQFVQEEDTAYHAGRMERSTAVLVKQRGTNPNYYSIGIEHEGTADSVWPETMYEDSARLVAEIAQRHIIPLDRTHVVGHHEIYALKSCPGRGDVDRIVTMAKQIAFT